MDDQTNRRELIHILRAAYSGELAAALAYRGHWKSLRTGSSERQRIQQIEQEEWVHRERVGFILDTLTSRPRKLKEGRMWIIGRVIGGLCYVLGWFMPMYFAGRLESQNVKEYESAAFYADALGLIEFQNDLLEMARVEKEHEIFFLSTVANHPLLPLMQSIFGWGGEAVGSRQ